MTDPAPHFPDPDAALDALVEWGVESRLVAARRDPLLVGALAALTNYGAITQVQRATGLTRQTIYRLGGEPGPQLEQDHTDDIDWDEYADYLDTVATEIEESLARIRPAGVAPSYTADDQRAALLRGMAEQIRDTERTDAGYWALTVELRERAITWKRPTVTLEGSARRSGDGLDAAGAQVFQDVADQITRYRTEGAAAVSHLNADTLIRSRASHALESWDLADEMRSEHNTEGDQG